MPPSPSPVLDAEHRAWNYWFVDGLANLVGGLLCLLLASVSFLVPAPHHVASPLVITLAVLGYCIYALVFSRFRQTLEWLKARITYPRTGYATPPYFTNWEVPPIELNMLNLSNVAEKEALNARRVREDVHRRGWFFVAIIAAAEISTLLIETPWICGVMGTTAGLKIWLTTRKNERMSWAVAFALPFAGLYMFAFPGLNRTLRIERLGFFLAGVGLVLVLTGAISLVRYLRRNRAARA